MSYAGEDIINDTNETKAMTYTLNIPTFPEILTQVDLYVNIQISMKKSYLIYVYIFNIGFITCPYYIYNRLLFYICCGRYCNQAQPPYRKGVDLNK